MSKLSIEQAVNLGDAATVPSLGPVRFEKIYPSQSGTKKASGEPYKKQVAILSDGALEVRATFWDREDIDSLAGQVRLISSVKSGNGRLGGVSVRSNTYEGKTTMELSISKAAVITAEEGVTEAAPVPATVLSGNVQAPPTPSPNIPPEVKSAVVVASKLQPIQKPSYADIIVAYAKCYRDAKTIIGDMVGRDGYLDSCQAMAFSLFKSSSDAGLVVGEESRTGGKVPAKTEQPF